MNSQLTESGYDWLRGVFTAHELDAIRATITAKLLEHRQDAAVLAASDGPAYGARNLLRLWPDVTELLHGRLGDVVLSVVGESACVVRGLYFDKPPGHSWALPWHRDYTLAVRAHHPSTRFNKPTIKAEVPHVEGPSDLLASMLTLRIHLDAMTADNGPLRVVPGSHLTTSNDDEHAVTLQCDAGDVLLMRPLLLHASGHSTPDTTQHRRIVHLECAPSPHLDDGFEYDRVVPIAIASRDRSSRAK